MKKKLLLMTMMSSSVFAGGDAVLRIEGALDGPLAGGLPKLIEIYVETGGNLGNCGVGSANNGGGSDGQEFTFPAGSAMTGSHLYVTSDLASFNSYFGFAADYEDGVANINGDDAIEIFCNGSVIDVFGDINVDGTGQPWEHLDGWAHRDTLTPTEGGTFDIGQWSFSGPNALDGCNNAGVNDTNATCDTMTGSPFYPIGTLPVELMNFSID